MIVDNTLDILDQGGGFLDFVNEQGAICLAQESDRIAQREIPDLDVFQRESDRIRKQMLEECALARLAGTGNGKYRKILPSF
jgi:hypothetical protein